MESGSEVRGGCTKLSGERWMSQMRDCGTGESGFLCIEAGRRLRSQGDETRVGAEAWAVA